MQDRPVTAARLAMQSCCWVQMRSIHACGPSAATALTGELPDQLQRCIMQQPICDLPQSYSTFDFRKSRYLRSTGFAASSTLGRR